MILQCTSDNLGGRRSATVGENNEGNVGRGRLIGSVEDLLITTASANAGDLLASVKEQVGNAR